MREICESCGRYLNFGVRMATGLAEAVMNKMAPLTKWFKWVIVTFTRKVMHLSEILRYEDARPVCLCTGKSN